jgi:hypothetical protein
MNNNLLSIATRCTAKGICKFKYNSEEVNVKWKIKSEKDAKENYCETGFIYIYF